MRPLPLLVILTLAAAQIYGDGSHASSLMKKFQKKDLWGSLALKPLPRKEIPADLRKGLYRLLNRYPQFIMLLNPGETQGLPIEVSVIGKRRNGRTKIGRRILGDDAINIIDDHAVKTRALFTSLICPSDTIKLHGVCKNIPKSDILDYDDYSQIFGFSD